VPGGRDVQAERPAEGGGPLRLGVALGRLLPRVQAEQVVEAVAARRGRLQELGVDQPFQRPLGGLLGLVQQPGHDRHADLGAVQQPQRVEQPRRGMVHRLGAGSQLLARDREAGPDARLGQLQLVEAPLGVAEPLGQRPDRPARPSGQPCSRDPQRQRQPPAPAGHVRRGPGLGGDDDQDRAVLLVSAALEVGHERVALVEETYLEPVVW
jgi:hypothetical protein